MDKGRNFLQWGFASGRLTSEPLGEGIFQLVAGMQRVSKSIDVVQEATSFFGIDNAVKFQEVSQKLSAVLPAMHVTVHGTPGSSTAEVKCGPEHGAPVTWPTVFVHLCEAKQTLNAFGVPDCAAICRQSSRYPESKVLGALLDAGSLPECFCLNLVFGMGILRHRIRSKRPCPLAYTSQHTRKKRKAVLPVAGDSPVSVETAHTPTSPVDQESQATDYGAKSQATDHGVIAESDAATQFGTTRCACNGLCANRAPVCPARVRFYKTTVMGGCPNLAVILDSKLQRHFCSSCRCRKPGFLE